MGEDILHDQPDVVVAAGRAEVSVGDRLGETKESVDEAECGALVHHLHPVRKRGLEGTELEHVARHHETAESLNGELMPKEVGVEDAA